jgi:Bifunctional DNA primase/polymerase, N-terminal/Protein of unknown function (DUF3987)
MTLKNPDLLQSAIAYRESGLSIIPTGEDKAPAIPWKPYQEKIATEQEIRSWFPRFANLGVVCGKVSGNLELIDFDNEPERDIETIFHTWRTMLDERGPDLFERLTIQRTRGKGFHVVYRCPDGGITGNQKLARFVNGSGEPRVLIETRGEGGQFLAWPSAGYQIMAGDLCDPPVVTPEERGAMLECARAFNEYVEPSRMLGGPTLPQGQGTRHGVNGGKSPGDDYNERGDLAGLLARHGWQPVRGDGSHQYYRRPGKDRGGHSASLIDGRTFYVFSSNAHPFEADRGYSPFGAYSLLEHDGDYQRAAKELARKGYGERRQLAEGVADTRFPDIMTGLAGDFARLYASYLEVPAHFLYMAFLTCLGIVLANKLTLASEIAPQPRLYVVLLGESADDRKSTALTKTLDVFKGAVEKFPVCWGVGSAEGLQGRLESSNRLLLCFDEFKQFISKCKIEASVLLPCVNTLFDSNRYESRTKKGNICIETAYLGLLAAPTVQTYENTWSAAFTDIGFNNRLFLVPGHGERRFSLPAKIPDKEKYLLKQRLGELLRHVGGWLEFDLSLEAQNLYHSWYMSLEKSIHAKRLDVYALRLMSLLAINELKSEVDAETVRKVTALCDWQFHIRLLHDPVDADNEVARMEEKIRRVLTGRGDLTDRDLQRAVHANRKGVWFYSTAKRNLKSSGELGFNKRQNRYFLRRNS